MPNPPRATRRRSVLRRLQVSAGLACLAGAVAVGLAPSPAVSQEADACAGVTETVSLIGSSSAKEALIGWGPDICEAVDVVADYTDFGSHGGRQAVLPGDAEVIGLTSLPFTGDEQATLKANKRGIVLVPLIGSSVTCTYWDTNQFDQSQSGKRFPNLRMSRRTLADLSGGSPRDGTNASVDLAADNADNPDFKVGPPYINIEVWMRSGYSAVTHQLTDWIHQDPDAEADFTKGSLEGRTLPFEDIETPDGSSPALINDYTTMKQRMLGGLGTLGVGCMDGATSRTDIRPETEAVERFNLALLDNPAGEFVGPSADAVTRALAAMAPRSDGTFATDWELEDPKAYALPLVVYAAMPTCGIDAQTRTAMDEVIAYGLGAGQQDLPLGNVALPPSMAEVARTQLAAWRAAAKAEPCVAEPTTTTTTTPQGPTSTLPPFEEPPAESTGYVPPATSGGAGGVYTDPSLGAASDLGGSTGAGDASAGSAGGAGAGGAPTEEVEGPATPLRRVAAMATGSAAVPPSLLLGSGAALLLAGPALQFTGGRRGTGTFASAALGWFSRLRP